MQSINVSCRRLVTDQPEDLAFSQFQVDLVDRSDPAKALDHGQALKDDGRVFGDRATLADRRRFVDVGAVDFLGRMLGVGAGDEHRAQDVGPVEQLGGVAFEPEPRPSP